MSHEVLDLSGMLTSSSLGGSLSLSGHQTKVNHEQELAQVRAERTPTPGLLAYPHRPTLEPPGVPRAIWKPLIYSNSF